MAHGSRLLVVLPDPLREYAEKGEIKPRYYNPGEIFDEVHFVSFCEDEIDLDSVQIIVGAARMVAHPVGPWTGVRLPSVLLRIRSIARAIAPQVIRAYDPFVGGLCAVSAGRAQGCPVVISVHNDFDHLRRVERRLKPHLARFLERYTLSRATRVICVTRALVPYVLRYGAKSVEVIYNRVDLEQFGGNRRGPVDSPRRILAVGRLVPQKDHACLLKAIAGLDVELTIIGNGPLGPSLKALAVQLGIAERVRFIPAVPHTEIQRRYAEADLFAIATRYEGFCIPVLEAMAAGLPVVASAVPPIQEVLNGAGYAVEHTPERFREAIGILLKDPSEYMRCRQEGLRRASELDGAKMEQDEVDLYRNLIEMGDRGI
jgi:glycosyltransferase involved in cell wall biosynthesis